MIPWVKPPINAENVRRLAAAYNIDLLTASVLSRRGINESEKVVFFLEDDERFLHNPFLFPEMAKAVERVLQAAESGEKILICGDKDVDGITATVLMTEALCSLGLSPDFRVPLGDEDYGLNPEVLRHSARDDVTLIITVDCGMTDFDSVALAEELGMDVLIFDHHTPREGRRPEALAVLNPRLSTEYPFDGLCAAAIVSKFQWALCFSSTSLWDNEFCLILAEKDPEPEDSISIEVLKMKNLVEIDRLRVSSSDPAEQKEKLLLFIEGQHLLGFDNTRQIPLISHFFNGAEVHLIDMAPEIAKTFPKLQKRSLEHLSGSGLISRYFPERSGLMNTLMSLFISMQCRRYAESFLPWRRGLDLAALGILADLMPMTNENRILVRLGLSRLNCTDGIKERRPAIRELLMRQRLHEGSLSTVEIAWQICPVINASGRMGQADIGVKLLLSSDQETIESLADELVKLNKKRRKIGEQFWEKLYPEAYRSMEDFDGSMLIVSDDQVPRGITGILATRLHKATSTPAVVISRRNEHSSGSIRTGGSFSALSWLEAMSGLLDDFGGHPQAGGFRIATDKLDQLSKESRRWVSSINSDPAKLEPITIDAELSHNEFTRLGKTGLDQLIERFEPYGEGFRPLIFLTRSVRIHSAEFIGQSTKSHLKLLVSLGSEKWPALWWDGAERYGKDISIDKDVDLVYRFDRDRWRGHQARRLTVVEATPCGK